jgi:hypothetical protein
MFQVPEKAQLPSQSDQFLSRPASHPAGRRIRIRKLPLPLERLWSPSLTGNMIH